MVFPEFRKIFWITGLLLYIIPFILNLFNKEALLYSILFFFLYFILFLMFFFTEEYDYYKHITITITIISIAVYPIIYIGTNNAGKYLALKSEINKLNEFVDVIKNFKNVESLNIENFESENKLNDIKIKDDIQIFENFDIDKSYYDRILREMNIKGIKVLRKDKNTIFLKMNKMPGLVYYINPRFKYSDKQYTDYNIRIDENWYGYDY